ncbi:hypothetical protein [Deinococcus yunweiensis]|uniref:hypothetical protein n=1 Tax=Deinococcus yunweiensis TaxID=367282 RepID=UPI00398F62E4
MAKMLFELGRAHRRFLGLAGPWTTDLEDSAMPIEQVVLGAQLTAFFQAQLYLPGTFRSGPIFGHRDDGTLHAVFGAPAGYLKWSDYDPERPLQLDASYVLGWADALQVVSASPVDWVGTWLSFPDTRVPTPEQAAPLIRQASDDLLSDYNTALLIIGWNRHELEVQGYSAFDRTLQSLSIKST